MSENPRRGRQARNFTTNVPKILDLKSSSEQIFFRKLSLGAPAWTRRTLQRWRNGPVNMGSVFDSLLLGSKRPNFQLVHCPCQPMGYKPTTRLGLSTAIWKKKSLKEKKQIEGRCHELSKLGRQHTKAPLAAALSPFMSLLYPPNTRCDWCVKVGHTTGVYVPYSFRKVVWVLLRPTRTKY